MRRAWRIIILLGVAVAVAAGAGEAKAAFRITSGAATAGQIDDVSAIGRWNAWAFGPASGWLLHYNGSWHQVQPPSMPGAATQWPNDVSLDSATSGWLVGRLGKAARWNGTAWEPVATPQPDPALYYYTLEDVLSLSPTNAWAIGEISGSRDNPVSNEALVEHWNGTRWRIVPTPAPTDITFRSLAAHRALDVWAVGFLLCTPARNRRCE